MTSAIIQKSAEIDRISNIPSEVSVLTLIGALALGPDVLPLEGTEAAGAFLMHLSRGTKE